MSERPLRTTLDALLDAAGARRWRVSNHSLRGPTLTEAEAKKGLDVVALDDLHRVLTGSREEE